MKRPLRLTGPWYRWERQGVHPRESRPVIQKYDGPDLVDAFLADPQRSLLFNDDDLLYRTVPAGPGASYLQKLAGDILQKTNTRKLFLASHKRFYLVVCELHCDGPGLPDLPASRPAEYGFVLRRLRGGSDGVRVLEASELTPLLDLSRKVAQLRAVSNATPPSVGFRRAKKRGRPGSQVHAAFEETRARQMATLSADILRLRAEVGAAMTGDDVTPLRRLEGWVPSEHDGIGSWTPMDAEPAATEERVYPLYPLVPDPRSDDHSAEGATLLFGMVPTSSLETDAWGGAHLDASHNYRIRCLVREPSENECPGPLRWSQPSAEFRLAAHMDPVGTANRAITVQMPDLKTLRAHAVTSAKPPGGLRIVTPEASETTLTVDDDGNPVAQAMGGNQICWFSIPLITIVARFVLQIFLPIVIIIFQLWWMLLLKLCIPPSIGFDAKLEAAADIEGSFDVNAELDVDVQVSLGVVTHGDLRDDLMKDFLGAEGSDVLGMSVGDLDGDEFAALAGARLAHLRSAEAGAEAAEDGVPPEASGTSSLVTGLDYELRVHGRPTVDEVVARLGAA